MCPQAEIIEERTLTPDETDTPAKFLRRSDNSILLHDSAAVAGNYTGRPGSITLDWLAAVRLVRVFTTQAETHDDREDSTQGVQLPTTDRSHIAGAADTYFIEQVEQSGTDMITIQSAKWDHTAVLTTQQFADFIEALSTLGYDDLWGTDLFDTLATLTRDLTDTAETIRKARGDDPELTAYALDDLDRQLTALRKLTFDN